MHYLTFAGLALVWGASFILMKKAVVCFSPLEVGWGRVAGGAATLAIFWWLAGRPRALRWKDAAVVAIVVFCGFAWPYTLQPYLVSADGSAFVAMTVSFTPLVTILIGWPMLGVLPTLRQFVGIVVALACLGVLMRDGLDRDVPLAHILLGVSVPAAYAVSNTCIRRFLSHVTPLELTFVSLAWAVLCVTPPAWNSASHRPQPPGDWTLATVCVLILGVLGTGWAMLAFNRLIRERGPLFAGMVTNLVPIGGVLWGYADGEPLSMLQGTALAGILSAVALVQFPAKRRPAVSDTLST